jgi:predicted metal-dependent peptidase
VSFGSATTQKQQGTAKKGKRAIDELDLNSKDLLKEMGDSEEQKVKDDLTRSRIQILMNFPFFGMLAMHLKLKKKYSVLTAATDGKTFYYNPRFIDALSESQINWIVIHEVMHPALKHLWRKGDKMAQKWNMAADYAVHDVMMQYLDDVSRDMRDKLEMPPGCLYDKKFEDMSAEQIYDELPDMPQRGGKGCPKKQNNNGQGNNKQGQGNGQGQQQNNQCIGCGQCGKIPLDDHSMWDDAKTQQGGQQKAADWEGKMVSAAKSAEAKKAGNVPGFIKRMIGNLTKPQKNWRELLHEFIEPEIDDYSFNPPDKRFGSFDIMMPDFNQETETVKDILFFVDTSGSVSNGELDACYSEIVGAINQFEGKVEGKLAFFDHTVYGPHDFKSVNDVVDIRPEGGGGTSFKVALDYVEEEMEENDVAGVIMLTDGYASFHENNPLYDTPVLWVVTNEDVTPPWGLHTTIKIDQ